MAYTATDLAAINAAIASGELSVAFSGRRVEYRSLDDLIKAKAIIEGEIAAGNGATRGGPRQFTFTTYRGE